MGGHVFGMDLVGIGIKTSCPLCNLNTLRKILMILGKNVELDFSMCQCVANKNENSGFLTFGVISLCFCLT